MAGSQISTSISILNSYLGFLSMSFSNRNNDSVPVIYAGSKVEIAGAYFTFPSNESINASSWTAITTGNTAYVQLTPAGTAGSQTVTAAWSETEPVWVTSKQGYYASTDSTIRVVMSAIKHSATEYGFKQKLFGESDTTTTATLISTVTYTANPTNGAVFTVYEPCMVYGSFDDVVTAGNCTATIQAQVDGDYTDEAYDTVSNTPGVVAKITTTYNHKFNARLSPGKYRVSLSTGSAPSLEPTLSLYRAGRLTDRTQ